MMEFLDIPGALAQPWTRLYVRVLAVILVYGGIVHVGNMLGINGIPWSESQFHLRVMDVVLLVFNVVVALGLWLRRPWAVVAFGLGIISLQVIPYTFFRSYFIQRPEDVTTLVGLVGTVSLLLGLLLILIVLKR